MGFFRKPQREPQILTYVPESFNDLTQKQQDAHMAKDTFGSFKLTDAIRPGLKFIPEEGYKYDVYHDKEEDEEEQAEVPVLMISASREKLFNLFLSLADEIGFTVDVFLDEVDEDNNRKTHVHGEEMDNPIVQSTLIDYEDLLLNDGFTGIALQNTSDGTELQFDAHKLLIVYGHQLRPFAEVCEKYGVREKPSMKFITNSEHIHASDDRLAASLDELAEKLGGYDEEQEEYV